MIFNYFIFIFVPGFNIVTGKSCDPIADLSFIFVKGDVNQTETILLTDAGQLLSNAAFKKNLQTLIYSFGFSESYLSADPQAIARAYLSRQNRNILVLDWSKYAVGNYFLDAIPNALEVGQLLGAALVSMVNQGFKISDFHLIGHSLGAHIMGVAGRFTAASENHLQILRITGLDPAGPGFFPLNPFLTPLSKSDAVFVDIIHTDPWIFGGKTKPLYGNILNRFNLQPIYQLDMPISGRTMKKPRQDVQHSTTRMFTTLQVRKISSLPKHNSSLISSHL